MSARSRKLMKGSRGRAGSGLRRLMTLMAAMLLSLLLFGGNAQATTVKEMTTSEQVAESDMVVLGTVLESRSYEDDKGMIWTETTVHVDQVLHGEADGTVVIRQMGGTVGEKSWVLPGDPQLAVDEQLVLFLADREPETGVVFLTALSQSRYRVVGQSETGDLILVKDLDGLAFYDPAKSQDVFYKDEVTVSLGELVAEVESAGGAR